MSERDPDPDDWSEYCECDPETRTFAQLSGRCMACSRFTRELQEALAASRPCECAPADRKWSTLRVRAWDALSKRCLTCFRRFDCYAVNFPDAHKAFPEAFVAFDVNADLHNAPDLTFRQYRKSGTYAKGGGGISRDRLLARAAGRQLVWHPAAAVWVRFSIGIRATPYLPAVNYSYP